VKALDFFCGAGGLTRGLLDAGIDVVAGVDADESCRQTYEENNEPSTFHTYDIRKLGVAQIKTFASDAMVSPDDLLLAACAPCQAFSQQRKSERVRLDATLLTEFGRLVQEIKPGWVLVENVPGIMRVPGFSTYRRFLKMLDDCEYEYDVAPLNAKYYGVPQNRVRMVLVASRLCPISLPERTHGIKGQDLATVRETIKHFPAIGPGEKDPDIPNHRTSDLTPINVKRIKATPRNGGDRRSWPKKLWLDCHLKDYEGHTDVYGRLYWDQPAPTLTGKCNSLSNGRYGHPTQDRAISLREAAALQSFHDKYEFFGVLRTVAQHIGNAVPPRLGKVLGEHFVHKAMELETKSAVS